MKLIRFGQLGKVKPGIINKKGQRLDVSGFGQDYTEEFFESNGVKRLITWLSKNIDNCPKVSENERLCSPICRPSKIVCVGLNYAHLPTRSSSWKS